MVQAIEGVAWPGTACISTRPALRSNGPLGGAGWAIAIEGANWETSLNNLLLTCKTIYHETAPIVYGSTVFYFDDGQRLRAFLEPVSDRYLAYITELNVHVRTYGISTEAANTRWEQKHVKCWTKIFAEIAKKMRLAEKWKSLNNPNSK